ncbi:MAG: peptidoglycan DD-metalloendopeptidase family protein [Betaproteobacteria bacterium]
MNLFSRGRFLLIAATLCAAGAATAATAPPKEELSQLRGRIEAMQKRLAAAEGARSEAADGLRDSERAISESNRSLRDLAAKQRAIQARLIDLQQQETRAGNDIESQQRLLARQLYQQYIGNQPDAVKLLLNREDPNRIARDLHYLTYLARMRAEQIRSLRASIRQLDDLEEETKQQSEALAAVQAEQQAQREKIEREKQTRRDVLQKVARQIESQRHEISKLKRDEQRLARLVEQISQMIARSRAETPRNERLPDSSTDGSAFAELKGKLSLPVRGELKGRFGSPRADGGLSWKGVFIASQPNQEVRAIAAGRVVFADWLRGFGNLLIIDHGGGYMSLYGNNESLFKQVGQAAKGGETIAAVGNSGGNTDYGLYFEMRHQGKAFDPLSWVHLK